MDSFGPIIVSYSPLQGAQQVSTSSSVLLEFDEEITKGSGNITLTPSTGAMVTLQVADSQVRVSNNTLNITMQQGLLGTGVSYMVQLEAGVVRDLLNNDFAGLQSGYSFNTVDVAGALGYIHRSMGYSELSFDSTFPNYVLGGEILLRTGGTTIMIDLRADHWLQPVSQACTSQIISEVQSNQVEPHGWQQYASSAIASVSVGRTGAELETNTLTLTLAPLPQYNISMQQVLVVRVPGLCVASNHDYQVATLNVRPSVCETNTCGGHGLCQELGFCKCDLGWGGAGCDVAVDCTVGGQCAASLANCPTCADEFMQATADAP